MDKMCVLAFVFSLNVLAFGQTKISGTVIDRESKSAIPYVNIGIKNKGVGTVSDKNGVFELSIPKQLINSYLTFSHLGYEEYTLRVSEIQENLKITLIPKPYELEEVVVTSKLTLELGHKHAFNSTKGAFSSRGVSNQVGTIIKNSKTVILKDFNFYLYESNYKFLKFRLNIYDVKSKQPNDFVNKSNILFTVSSEDKGVLTVNLKDKAIRVTDDFICTIELLEANGLIDNKTNAICTLSISRDKNGVSFKRLASLDKWGISKGYYLNFWFNAYEYD